MAVIANYGTTPSLTGATAATAFVGATASGAPVSGAFVAGNIVVDRTGAVWVCVSPGSPGTWAQVAGGTGSTNGNEGQAAVLVNATSPGDAGGRSDQFLGSSLGGQWTQESGQAITGVAYSVASGNLGAFGPAYYHQTYTPSGDFIVDWRGITQNFNVGGGCGVAVCDSGGIGGNGFLGFLGLNPQPSFQLYTIIGGSLAAVGTQILQAETGTQGWTYGRLTRSGTTCSAQWSYDRKSWNTAISTTLSFTAALMEIYFGGAGSSALDFVDVVA